MEREREVSAAGWKRRSALLMCMFTTRLWQTKTFPCASNEIISNKFVLFQCCFSPTCSWWALGKDPPVDIWRPCLLLPKCGSDWECDCLLREPKSTLSFGLTDNQPIQSKQPVTITGSFDHHAAISQPHSFLRFHWSLLTRFGWSGPTLGGWVQVRGYRSWYGKRWPD